MAKSSRRIADTLLRTAACFSPRVASSASGQRSRHHLHRHLHQLLLQPAVLLPRPSYVRPLATASTAQSPRGGRSSAACSTPPCGGMSAVVRSFIAAEAAASLPTAFLPSICLRSYAKRLKKWQGLPHAFIQVEPGAPCPPYSPNVGSVKNRKQKKRMAQRHAFIKAQAHQRKEETKAALIKRDAARRKRWREAAARARAWAKHLQEKQITAVAA